jgi:hypothetical protein
VKGSGVDGVVYAAALQSDGKVLIGGGSRNYDGAGRSGIARLQNPITVPAPLLVNPILSNNVFKVSLDTVSGKSHVLQFKNSFSVSNWTALPAVTGDGTMKTLVDASATGTKRVYRVQVE